MKKCTSETAQTKDWVYHSTVLGIGPAPSIGDLWAVNVAPLLLRLNEHPYCIINVVSTLWYSILQKWVYIIPNHNLTTLYLSYLRWKRYLIKISSVHVCIQIKIHIEISNPFFADVDKTLHEKIKIEETFKLCTCLAFWWSLIGKQKFINRHFFWSFLQKSKLIPIFSTKCISNDVIYQKSWTDLAEEDSLSFLFLSFPIVPKVGEYRVESSGSWPARIAKHT